MERRFQYNVPITNHAQYIARARAWEHNNTMEKFILNITHLFHVYEHFMDVRIFILRICAPRRRCLRGFRWYPYFVAQEQLVAS